jgi:LysM repeat protein
LNNAAALQSAFQADRLSGGWDKTIGELKRIAPTGTRSDTNIDYFTNPTAEFAYQVEPGDTIDGIAAKVGWTRAEFLARYPQYGNRPIKAGERIYFDSPTGSRRSGRIP